MDKKVIWFIIILAVIVVFFAALIIIVEIKSAGATKSMNINGASGTSGGRKYDVYKSDKDIEKKKDNWYMPSLEYKITGQKPIIDI